MKKGKFKKKKITHVVSITITISVLTILAVLFIYYAFIKLIPGSLTSIKFNEILMTSLAMLILVTSFIYMIKLKKNVEVAFKKSALLVFKIFVCLLLLPVFYLLFVFLYNNPIAKTDNILISLLFTIVDFGIVCSIMYFVFRKLIKISFGIVILVVLYLIPLSSGIISIPFLGEYVITGVKMDFGNMLTWFCILLFVTYIDSGIKYVFSTYKEELVDNVISEKNTEK